jgi:uncharacterized protein (DUF302 family)
MSRFAVAVLALALAGCGSASRKPAGDERGMLLSVGSKKTLAQLQEDIPNACAAQQFGVVATLDLKAQLRKKGVEYDGECLIFEVCNPQKARLALEACPEVSTALPCRISVYRTKDGKTWLSTLRPTMLAELYKAEGLRETAAAVEAALAAVLEQAAK